MVSDKQKSIGFVRSLLEMAENKYPELTFKQRRGKNEHGFNVYYQGEKLSEIWAYVGGEINKYHFWTNSLSDEDKAAAIPLDLNL